MDIGLNAILLLFVLTPGYIFVSVSDYCLLKREKTQFEKTMQGFAITMLLATFSLLFPCIRNRVKCIIFSDKIVKNLMLHYKFACAYFSGLNAAAFFLGFFWAKCNEENWFKIKIIATKLTGRDYFQNTDLKFYSSSIGRTMIIYTDENKTYKGELVSSSDNANDKYLIIHNPHLLIDDEFICLNADEMLICTDKIKMIYNAKKQEDSYGKRKK